MACYKITQEEFNTISELKNRFGNVSLVDLYNQSTVIDANSNAVPVPKTPIPSIEEVCNTLTDKQIEELLHEKIGNMCIYAHYDLAEHGAGLLSPHYNGAQPEFIRSEPEMIKAALESNLHEIKLVATAVKTIPFKDWSGFAGYSFLPVYHNKSSHSCGNVIFLDKKTGTFHAMHTWVCNYPGDNPYYASRRGLSQFTSNTTQNPYFQGKVLTQLSNTLRYARASQSLQR